MSVHCSLVSIFHGSRIIKQVNYLLTILELWVKLLTFCWMRRLATPEALKIYVNVAERSGAEATIWSLLHESDKPLSKLLIPMQRVNGFEQVLPYLLREETLFQHHVHLLLIRKMGKQTRVIC